MLNLLSRLTLLIPFASTRTLEASPRETARVFFHRARTSRLRHCRRFTNSTCGFFFFFDKPGSVCTCKRVGSSSPAKAECQPCCVNSQSSIGRSRRDRKHICSAFANDFSSALAPRSWMLTEKFSFSRIFILRAITLYTRLGSLSLTI